MQEGLCTGCLRTLDEIKAWGNASGETKKSILAAIARRRAQHPPAMVAAVEKDNLPHRLS